MKINLKKRGLLANTHKGITLLEILLVFAVGMVILLMGLRVYQQFSVQGQVARLQSNVDVLFQALASFYQANCRSGKLSPAQITVWPPLGPVSIDLTELQKTGAEFLRNWHPENPLVNLDKGYIIQFNPSQTSKKALNRRYVSTQFSTTRNPASISNPQAIKKAEAAAVPWRVQVAIRIKNTTKMQAYRTLLGADCISTLMMGNMVFPCDTGPGQGDYLVWERPPLFALPRSSSALSSSIARVQQFNQQYTNDDFYGLNVDDANLDKTSRYETYLCGG